MSAPALLYEMIRSFTTLARTLNLSHAVTELNSTRQTLRRHITQLEEAAGQKFFVIEGRHYQLTPYGEEMLPEALDLLARGKLWVTGQTGHVNNLLRFSHEASSGWSYYQQQQPLTHIWDAGSDLLRDSVTGWSKADGYLESEAMAGIRPYLMVYRRSDHGWICCEIGENSFYSGWWGWKNARSSIGRDLGKFPGGADFEGLMNQSFEEVMATGGLRLDEVVTQFPRETGGEPFPLAYQRLLLGGRFPDNSFALISIVERSQKIRIQGLDQSVLEQMPADAQVDYRR
ncbi:Transcriptional regulator, LysR family [Sulfitobacter noctilucicola]|nr:Transcriptional regulator, LysR family [Sulfitobacter noctilucicola]